MTTLSLTLPYSISAQLLNILKCFYKCEFFLCYLILNLQVCYNKMLFQQYKISVQIGHKLYPEFKTL